MRVLQCTVAIALNLATQCQGSRPRAYTTDIRLEKMQLPHQVLDENIEQWSTNTSRAEKKCKKTSSAKNKRKKTSSAKKKCYITSSANPKCKKPSSMKKKSMKSSTKNSSIPKRKVKKALRKKKTSKTAKRLEREIERALRSLGDCADVDDGECSAASMEFKQHYPHSDEPEAEADFVPRRQTSKPALGYSGAADDDKFGYVFPGPRERSHQPLLAPLTPGVQVMNNPYLRDMIVGILKNKDRTPNRFKNKCGEIDRIVRDCIDDANELASKDALKKLSTGDLHDLSSRQKELRKALENLEKRRKSKIPGDRKTAGLLDEDYFLSKITYI